MLGEDEKLSQQNREILDKRKQLDEKIGQMQQNSAKEVSEKASSKDEETS